LTITATYRAGTFVPDGTIDLPEGTRVQVTLPSSQDEQAAAVRDEFRRRFPESIGSIGRDEADELRSAAADLRTMEEERGR